MTATKTGTRKSRAPNGANCPTMLMLNETERQRLDRIAEAEVRSISATGRMLLLRSIDEYERQTLKNQ